MLMRWLALLVVALAFDAAAQEYDVRVFPSPPTTSRPVVLRVSWTGDCAAYDTFTRVGNIIEIKVASGCILVPFDSRTYNLGLLPAGNYTVRLVSDFPGPGVDPLVQRFDFAVFAGATEVPALDGPMLAALAAGLMTVALLVLRRAA